MSTLAVLFLPLFIIFMIAMGLIFCGLQQKKRLKSIVGVTILIAMIAFCVYKQGVFCFTHARKDTLFIVNKGTGSLGSHAVYEMDRTDVMKEVEKIYKSFAGEKFGWKFQAVKEGSCYIAVTQYDGGQLSHTYVYEVTVDEDLNVSYVRQRVIQP